MVTKWVDTLLQGDKLSLSRVLTQVENDTTLGRTALELLFPLAGKSYLIGITGSPGSGKSTLVNSLALNLRNKTKDTTLPKVAIIAVDPTSPYSGGALLGDRVRMQDLSGDSGIFIRSMASRGALGGLAHTTAAFTQVLDAAGYDIIIVETVGAGQAEVEIAGLAHTVIVVEAPGMGDDIQAIKAGILEIADILVVNKSDRPESQSTIRALRSMIEMAHGKSDRLPANKHLFNLNTKVTPPLDNMVNPDEWSIPVISTIATESVGLEDLVKAIVQHKEYLLHSGVWEKRERATIQLEFETLFRDTLARQWITQIPKEVIDTIMDSLFHRDIAPHTAVERLLAYNKSLK